MTDKVQISTEQLVRFQPVQFDETIVSMVEQVANEMHLSNRRMTSCAGQDAQMMARICPSAMIFVPSVNGISHNPKEYTKDEDIFAGANVFINVIKNLAQ